VANVSSAVMKDVVDRLVQGLHPERIYLFGSRSRGQAGEDSDIDLLVLVTASSLPRHRREALAYDLLWGLATPVDVIVLTQAEFEKAAQVKTSLAAVVHAEGKVVYE